MFNELYRNSNCIEEYDIHLCNSSEIEELLHFIDEYWQKNHVLTKSKDLLKWVYGNPDGTYNFILAREKTTNDIVSIYGFILSNRFDKQITTPICWDAIWKTKGDYIGKGLGQYLLAYCERIIPFSFMSSLGISFTSRIIHEKMGFLTGTMSIFYVLNKNIQTYALVEKYDEHDLLCVETKEYFKSFTEITGTVFLEPKDYHKYIPSYKSVNYYVNRYSLHPFYNYHFIEIQENGRGVACFIYRECINGKKTMISIVDFIGDAKAFLGTENSLQIMMDTSNAEFISFYAYGLEKKTMLDAGFRDALDSDIILMEYYEPPVMKKVVRDIHFNAKNHIENITIFKGDSDQDRPNQITKVK